MIIYNITIKIEHHIQNDWLMWMRTVHIPDVMATGLFVSHRLCKLLQQDEGDGVTYAVQYFCNNISDYFTYEQKHAAALQSAHQARYRNKYVAFRTLLRVIE